MIINTLVNKKNLKQIFNFIYYLRYLILVLIFSTFLLYSIPKIFQNVNKINNLNYILKNQHGFVIKNIDKIEYKIFPRPNFEIRNSQISIAGKLPDIKFKSLKIFINLKGLYIPEKINFDKIEFKGDYLGNNFNGNYTPKKNLNLLYLEFENLGISTKVFFDNKKKFPQSSGSIKLKILNNNLLINFDFNKSLNFKKFIYKNKNFLANLSGRIDFEPFFYFKLFAEIKKLNLEKIEIKKIYNITIDEISNKKLNGKFVIEFLTKKTKRKNGKANLLFKNGDIILKDTFFQFANLDVQMNAYLKKYPLYKDLNFELLINTENIDKFFKIIDLPGGSSLEKVTSSINGNINLDAKKYYFEKIIINKKEVDKKKVIKLKKYLDGNTSNFLNDDLNKKNFYQFLKNLFQFI